MGHDAVDVSGTERSDARFDYLVEQRKRCRALAKNHLSALETFRGMDYPGRVLTELDKSAVSLPGFMRVTESDAKAMGLTRDPFEFRVSSTCAAMRSVLRHPADYLNLRPLHILLEVYSRLAQEQMNAEPSKEHGHNSLRENVMQLGQIADLAEALQQAVRSARKSVDKDTPSAAKDAPSEKKMLGGAIGECLVQLIRRLKDLADAPLPTATGSGEVSNDVYADTEYALKRLHRVCHLARTAAPRGESQSNGASESTFVVDPTEVLEKIKEAHRLALPAPTGDEPGSSGNPIKDLVTSIEGLFRQQEGTDADPKSRAQSQLDEGPKAIRDQIAGWIESCEVELPSLASLMHPRREYEQSEIVAGAIIERARGWIRGLLRVADGATVKLSYEKVRVDRFSRPHPYVLYWALAGLRVYGSPKKEERFGTAENTARVEQLLQQARSDYHRLLALAASEETNVDAIRLGYHLALEAEFNPDWDPQLARFALGRLAKAQRRDGGFPKCERMWLTSTGDAYGLGIELLTSLLIAFKNKPDLLDLLEPCLERSIDWLGSKKRQAPDATQPETWVWGEDGMELQIPQAWVTGEAYSFLYLTAKYYSGEIAKLAVERFRGSTNSHVTAAKSYEGSNLNDITADFWGAPGNPKIGEVLFREVVDPLWASHRYFGSYVLAPREQGDLKKSGLLFGPPGTGKTTLVERLAESLGWPLVKLSPYDFLRDGQEGLARSAREVFRWLYELEDCVVLFDEMEELVRARTARDGAELKLRNYSASSSAATAQQLTLDDRSSIDEHHHLDSRLMEQLRRGPEEPKHRTTSGSSTGGTSDPHRSASDSQTSYVQRLWTTLFLPLLQDLHDEGRVVFFVATNHLRLVDPAIARPGRFDFLIYMFPPTPRCKVDEILVPELSTQLSLPKERQERLRRRLHDVLLKPTWLVEDDNGPPFVKEAPDAHSEKRHSYVTLRMEQASGGRAVGKVALGSFFRFFTRADTRETATAAAELYLQKHADNEGWSDARLDDVRDAVLKAMQEVVPDAFEYDTRENYLNLSRLCRTRGAAAETGSAPSDDDEIDLERGAQPDREGADV